MKDMKNMKSTRKSVKQERSPEGKPSKAGPAGPDAEGDGDRIGSREAQKEQEALIARMFMLLKPLIDFHQPVDGATAHDLRMYWDVRILRGRDTPFTHVTGSSSLPGTFALSMLANAPSLIQKEVTDKIIIPLTAVMQGEVVRRTHAELGRENQAGGPGGGTIDDPCDGRGD